VIVEIEIRTGPAHREQVFKRDIQKNIDALNRAIEGKLLSGDFVLLIDTRSILEGVQNKLP